MVREHIYQSGFPWRKDASQKKGHLLHGVQHKVAVLQNILQQHALHCSRQGTCLHIQVSTCEQLQQGLQHLGHGCEHLMLIPELKRQHKALHQPQGAPGITPPTCASRLYRRPFHQWLGNFTLDIASMTRPRTGQDQLVHIQSLRILHGFISPLVCCLAQKSHGQLRLWHSSRCISSAQFGKSVHEYGVILHTFWMILHHASYCILRVKHIGQKVYQGLNQYGQIYSLSAFNFRQYLPLNHAQEWDVRCAMSSGWWVLKF